MRALIFLWMLMLVAANENAVAQVSDTFTDGDFTSAPSWTGDVSRFTVVDGKLKLQAPAVAGTAHLITPSRAIHQAEWKFRIQLDFTPSSSNYAKVFVVSDQPALGGTLNGYFIKIGNTTREVSLYRQTGVTETEIIDGTDDRINQAVVVLNVRLTRDDKGMWELFSNVASSGGFVLEGSVMDNTHSLSGWFGIQCVYSSTRSDKFWFDDFNVAGSVVPDLQPPAILAAKALDPWHVQIEFSEPVVPSGIATEKIEIIGIGSPTSIVRSANGLMLECSLPASLRNGISYQLKSYGFEDSAGNIMPSTEMLVRYFVPAKPATKSILITEIFADPSPQVGLPAAEFVELFNPGSEPFELQNWRFTDGSSSALLPAFVMLPGMYVVLTSTSGTNQFGSAAVIPLSNFPSLNNSGDHLLLSDDQGMAIDSVHYMESWYRDEDKAAGGWSLELIDPANPCGEENNWAVSENDQGGTPGFPNSVLANKPDLTPPAVVSVTVVDAFHISVLFNELLQASSLAEASITWTPPRTTKDVALDQASRGMTLTLEAPLLPRTPYQLQIDGIRDCSGNLMEIASLRFGLPEPADSLDVVLSEVLFNPRPGGVDFVEVFNASEKYINMNWSISNGDTEVFLPARQMAPKEWLAFTTDPDLLRSQYASGNLERAQLPSLPDASGTIILRDNSRRIMDTLAYEEDWHAAVLQAVDGVSLERIDFSAPTQNRDNWASAASAVGFGTPGRPNSHMKTQPSSTTLVSVIPEIFSPGSLTADFVQVHYHFDEPGHVSNVRIYDRRGIEVKLLAANATLGSDGFLRWDGDTNSGMRASAGYYILWFECFDLTGRVETILKRIILAPR